MWLRASTGRWTLSRFSTDFALVGEKVFIELVHELAKQVPLGKPFCIDGTDIPVDQRDDDAAWNYDHTDDDYYYGYGRCVVTAANNIPVAAAFTPAKKVDQETAMRVTRDALVVETSRWIVGDSEFDMLDWHDHLLAQSVVPVAPYNPRKRPERGQVRLEREDVKETTLYHNYGHGGSGVTLSWGCAINIVNRFESDILEALNDVNPNRDQKDTVDISIEIAHSDTSPDSDDFDKIVSKSVERAKRASKRFDPELRYNFVVLIDDKSAGVKRDIIKDKILESIGDSITVDYICYESELEFLLSGISSILSDKTEKSIQGYIGNNGHTACSHDILIWYCLRLGLLEPDSNIIEAVSDRAKSGNIPFISDKNMSILREGVTKHEQWAAEYLEESFPAEVVATAHNNIYYSID